MRDHYHGLGKPEPLKGNLSGCGAEGLMKATGWFIR